MPRSISFDLIAIVALLLPDLAAASITLSQFQAIVGFPTACTNAYDSPVAACTSSDFSNGNPCSQACIAALEELTTTINTACQGSKANPKSLIGLFFQDQGVSSLCPNSASSSSSVQASSTLVTSTAVTLSSTTTSQSTTRIDTTTRDSSTSTSSTTSSTTARSTTSTTSTASIASTTSTSSSSTNSADSTLQITGTGTSTTSFSRNTQGFTTTVFNEGQASVITSKPQQTDSSNPEAFGGGGSPFEVGPNGSDANRAYGITSLRLAATLAAAFLIAVGLS